MKRFVVGDIHGNHKALLEVFKKAKFNYDKDFLIIIGDVVDGYENTYEVVEELLKVKHRVFIIGNHDQWFMNHMKTGWAEPVWLSQGGENTLKSYKKNLGIPLSHYAFFNLGVYWLELDNMMFVHGGFKYPTLPCNEKNMDILTWDRSLIDRAKNGLKMKEWDKVFVGHTTTENEGAEPISYDGSEGCAELIQVDCGAGWKGRLCLYNIDTDKYFLSKYAGRKVKE